MKFFLRNNTVDKIALIIIGALLYGLLNFITSGFKLPAAPIISLRPQIAIPMFVGLYYGPIIGFFVGFLGNMFGDFISGYGIFSFWNWSLANGTMGLFTGIINYWGYKNISSVKEFAMIESSIIGSSFICVATAIIADMIFLHKINIQNAMNSWLLPAFISNAILGFIEIPLLMILFKKFTFNIQTKTMLVITYLLIISVLVTTISIVWSSLNSLKSENLVVQFFYNSATVTLFVITLGLVLTIILSKNISDPVIKLKNAALSIENSSYDFEWLNSVTNRTDEIGDLSRVMKKMADEVQLRESNFKIQIKELKIEIDQIKKNEEIKEIIEGDFFKELKLKARKF